MTAVRLNPVLGRELRERMRRNRSPVILFCFLVVLSTVVILAYMAFRGDPGDPDLAPAVTRLDEIGRATFGAVLAVLVAMVLFLVPGTTAASVAGERERQTLVSLQMTPLRPLGILWGKVTSSLAFIVLLIVAGLPVLAVTYLIGGVSVGEIAAGLGVVLVLALVTAIIGVACSTFAKRSSTGILLCYSVILLLVVGPTTAFGVAALLDRDGGLADTTPYYLLPNPLMGVVDAVGQSEGDADSLFDIAQRRLDPSAEQLLTQVLEDEATFFDFGPMLGEGGDLDSLAIMIGVDAEIIDRVKEGTVTLDDLDELESSAGFNIPSQTSRQIVAAGSSGGFPFWAQSLLFQVVLALLLLWLAVRRIRVPATVDR